MPDLDDTISAIRYWHRRRCFAMESRQRINLALGSFLRLMFGWSRSLPKAESDAIKARVAALVAEAEDEARLEDLETRDNADLTVHEKGSRTRLRKKMAESVRDPALEEWRDMIRASLRSREPWDRIEAQATAEMERLAETLPGWSWAKDIKGFSARQLAVIVGEAGDLSNYPKQGHLWKRMGLAVIDGKRQGGLTKNAPKDEWIAHGYSRVRRSRMFVIGDCLVKAADVYYDIFLARKEYERRRAFDAGLKVVPAAKIPKGRTAEFMSEGHVRRRAQRYMEKRLLRDLWKAWRSERGARDDVPEGASGVLPRVIPFPNKAA